MFFSTYVLTRKGPLAKIWLAAHWDKKLTRNEIKVIDLNQTVLQIAQPTVPIALRTSGELLIGVVRIYALKVKQLHKDATEATIQLRAANVQVVKGKDNAVAVTMDIVVGKVGSEAVCEADFDGIADIIKGGKPGANFLTTADQDKVIGNAWFTMESSQYLEEHIPASQDEMARVRAELADFKEREAQRREESSNSKKSSHSSIEKARASGANAIDAALGEALLDIGVPIPDDVELPIPMIDVAGIPEDPFLVPEAPEDAAAPAIRLPKKKIVNILDAAATVWSKAECTKLMADRSDIVNAERRHGPIDEEESRDRFTIRAAEGGNIVNVEPLSHVANPALRAAFAAAVRTSVNKAVAEAEASRASDRVHGAANGHAHLHADDVQNVALDEIPPPEFDYIAEEPREEGRPSKKRGRGEEESNNAFSASTLATLEKLRTILKKANKDTHFSQFAPPSTTRRVDAARTFVDVLQLASHSIVGVKQVTPYGDILLQRTAQLSQPVPAS